MGLFNFLKPKKEKKLDIHNEKDHNKIISLGILFEDTKEFLRWDIPIKEISKNVIIKEKRFADRTVYNWGEHSILEGLKLEFTTVHWDHRRRANLKDLMLLNFGQLVMKLRKSI